MNLIELFQEVEDPRISSGRRHSIELVLTLGTMSIMSGQVSFRSMGDFVNRHKKEIQKYFQPGRDSLPSYSTFRRVFNGVDNAALCSSFHRWSFNRVKIKKGEWLHVDGKSIKNTVKDYENPSQDFISLVSLYSSRHKQVLGSRKYHNKKQSETVAFDELLEDLDLKGVVFTMDALYLKKNG